MAHGRLLADFGQLSNAEKRLLRCAARGEIWQPAGWDGKRPTTDNVTNRLRAGLIRFLLLGGDADNPVHEEGVMIAGAWLPDELSLRQIAAVGRLVLHRCHLAQRPMFIGATFPELSLTGSFVPGVSADRMEVKGGAFLNDGFEAAGEVRMLGAKVGGNLTCNGCAFRNVDDDGAPMGAALSADLMNVSGSVFLNGGFEAVGAVRLLGAKIGGNLTCKGGTLRNANGDGAPLGAALSADRMMVEGNVFLDDGFKVTGAVHLLGAQIGGQLSCAGSSFRNADGDGVLRGYALSADGMTVKGGFFLRGVSEMLGPINLANASVAQLVDDGFDWPGGSILDGFRYDSIVGSTNARRRIAWLSGQRPSHISDEFKPQPWEQLISVLRAMGHKAEAADIAIAKQNALRKAHQIGVREPKSFPHSRVPRVRTLLDGLWNPVSNWLARGWHRIYGLLSGYGHRPQRILFITLALVSLSSLAFYEGRHDGLIGPTDPLVYMNAQTAGCGTGGDPGVIVWTDPDCPVPPEYTTFQPFFFALDIALPFVDLHQESEWAPLVTNQRGETLWGGRLLRWLMWFNIIFGWVASLMFVAIVSRLVEKD